MDSLLGLLLGPKVGLGLGLVRSTGRTSVASAISSYFVVAGTLKSRAFWTGGLRFLDVGKELSAEEE